MDWWRASPLKTRLPPFSVRRRLPTLSENGRLPASLVEDSEDSESLLGFPRIPCRRRPTGYEEGRYKATGKRRGKLPWREAGPLNHLDDKVDPDQ